jgi:DNA-binding CsgD family transcriptional regulator
MQKRNYLDVIVRPKNEEQRLSGREKEVLRFLADGDAPSEIAQALRLSLKTVQTYCWRLRQKLGSQSMTQLIRDAVLLCNARTTGHFDESLKRVDSIEVRYFDWRGKLIATRKFRAQTMPRLRGSKS